MDHNTIAHIQSLGFEVWMRGTKDTWLLYTDGKNIGYLQEYRYGGYSISTVHKPNSMTGTGFGMLEGIPLPTREQLELGFRMYPSWGLTKDEQASVRKYKDMDEYRSRGSFEAAYAKVEAITLPGNEWSGSPCPDDPDNYWIDDETGERVNAHTGERSDP